MKTKSLTPFPFGTKVTSRRPPQREMAVIVRGLFRLRPGEPVSPLTELLAQGTLSAERFAEGDDERAGECLYPGDFADFKLCTEVMARGSCHAPSGRPVAECDVRLGVGGWSKTLRVFGRRVWTEKVIGAAISPPAPFLRMPLGYSNAFGGPARPLNPAGKGYDTAELPSVESPAALLRSRRDDPPPAGFGPINPAWPERARKVGKAYGPEWRKKRFPFYADDLDWTYFHAAPADQQLGRYLRGDEEMTFENLHPRAAVFSAALPALRIRAFVRAGDPGILEAAMSLDTLFADLDAETLAITWRGLVPVREDDLSDVKTLLLASEPLAERPRPAEHYHAVLEAFEADPLEKEKLLPPEMRALMDVARGGGEPPGAPVDQAASVMSAAAASQPGGARAGMDHAIAEMRKAAARFDAFKADPANANAAANAGDAAAQSATAVSGMLDNALKRLRSLRERATAEGAPPDETARMDALLERPELKALADKRPPPEPGPGQDLSDSDLSGRDLRGCDLTGANLSGARLLGTRLFGARLAGANLRRALLHGAHLEGADLTGADLTQAVLAKANLREAILASATLDGALFDEADLTSANLRAARGKRVFFARATLVSVNAQGADLDEVVSFEADVGRADFRRARLTRCMFFAGKAQGLLLGGATIHGSAFVRCDLSQADAQEADARRAVFRGSTLDGVDFRWARLEDAHFDQASARGARFFGANMLRASLYRAVLDDADLARTNLLGANLARTSLARTSFNGANLYAAKLLGAAGAGVSFTDANVKRAVFDPT